MDCVSEEEVGAEITSLNRIWKLKIKTKDFALPSDILLPIFVCSFRSKLSHA
jgi:hypothetical protein